MLPTFVNTEYQKCFEEDGYIIIDIVTKDILDGLKQLFDENFIRTDNPRSNFNAVSEEEKTSRIIKESIHLLANCFDKVFVNYTNQGSTFFTKDKHHGELGLHQDTTIINFQKHFACYSWIPLQTVTKENGCICLVEKSHLFYKNFISFTYKNEKDIPLDSISPKFLKVLEMKLGEVLFFDNRLFHGSFPNQTDELRVAINALITSKNAELVYYQKKDNNTASEYFVTANSMANSYRSFSKGLLPDGAVFSRDIPYKHTSISSKELNQSIEMLNPAGFNFSTILRKIFG